MEPAWFAAGAAGAGALAAWFAAINGSRTLRRARLDSQAKSRPMLAAELRLPQYGRGIQSLVIRNLGPTIARNVRVMFDPEIPEPPKKSVTTHLKKRYENPVSVMTPGMELENLYFVGRPGRGGVFENSEPTPSAVTVTIAYEGPDGAKYSDAFYLDVSLLGQQTFATSSTAPEEQLKEAVKALKAIHRSLVDLAPKSGRGLSSDEFEAIRKKLSSPGSNRDTTPAEGD